MRRRKQAGKALVSAGRYEEAAAEYSGALAAMRALLEQLPSSDAAPMRAQLEQLEQQSRLELEQAQAQAVAVRAQTDPGPDK